MRTIKSIAVFDKVELIRVNVFENILSQIASEDTVNFSSNKYLQRILSLPVKLQVIETLLEDISKHNAQDALEASHIQNYLIRQDILKVPKLNISESIVKLVEFIYENILFYPTYWDGIGNFRFSKMILKETIFNNQGNCICPYCDSEEDLSLLSYEIDHLLPKSDFPMLYLNEMNLIPCCQTCNHQHYGKGNRYLDQYYNLHNTEIGLKTQFYYNENLKIKGIDEISDDYIKLIKLEKRHNQTLFFTKISNLEKKITKDLKTNISNRTFLDYNAPHYYLTKELYEKCSIKIMQCEIIIDSK